MTNRRPTLLYFGDAMCSWCYGFAPQMERVLAATEQALNLFILSGGLRPFTREAMTEEAKEKTRGHWARVAEATGQPFDGAFFEREGFVYDSEPASRAVVTVRTLQAPLAYPYMSALHTAFYAGNRDITDESVLADVAGEMGIERDHFLATFRSAEAAEATMNDFRLASRLKVDGFPTLVLSHNDRLLLVTRGYAPAETVMERLVQASEAAAA